MPSRTLCALIFSVLLCLPVVTTSADEIPENRYVVTATREEADTLETPAVIRVITQDDIAASGKTSLISLLEDTAGVSFKSFSTEAQSQIAMRGFGDNSFGRVAILVDGKKINNPDMAGINWLSIPLAAIERIEVLDGPAAVTYGSGAIGGVINIITRGGTPGLTAEASLSWGSFDTKEALLTGGWGSERAGFLVSADLLHSGGYRDETAIESTNIHLGSYVAFGDFLMVKPALSWSNVSFELPGGLTKEQDKQDPTQSLFSDGKGDESGWTVSLSTNYDRDGKLTVDLPLEYLSRQRSADIPSSWGYSYYDYDQSQFSARPRFGIDIAPAGLPSRITVGLDGEYCQYSAEQWGEAERTLRLSEYEFIQSSISPWLTARLSPTKALILQAGFRLHWNQLETNSATGTGSGDTDSTDTAFEGSISWRLSKAVSLHVKGNTLFRIPFIDEVLTYGTFLDHLESERGWNTEIGIKYMSDERLSLQAVLYHLLMEDEIAYNMQTMRNENLDRTRRWGLTADGQWKPLPWFLLSGNLSWVHAIFDAGIHEGENIPLVPSLTAGGSLSFFLPQGVTLGADITWTGETDDPGSLDMPDVYGTIDSYSLLGAQVHWKVPQADGKLSVTARVNNILDLTVSPLVYWGTYYPAAGRSFTLNAAYRY